MGENPPEPPEPEFAHLLLWYFELRGANSRGWRFEPISYTEIFAYSELMDLRITTFEVQELRALDVLWQQAQPEPEKTKK